MSEKDRAKIILKILNKTYPKISVPLKSRNIFTLLVSIKIGYTRPSGPFLFLAMKILPELVFLSSTVREIEKIKSATKHLLNASEIDSIVITSALRPDLFVCDAVHTGQLYIWAIARSSS